MKMISLGESAEGLYRLILKDKYSEANATYNSFMYNIPDHALWHFRLGYISPTRTQIFNTSLSFIVVDKNIACDVCHYAKHKRMPYYSSFNKSKQPFDIVRFDVWGLVDIKYNLNHSYFLIVVDGFSRYTWLILMKHKSETRQNVIDFIKMVETQHNSHVNTIISNNGSKFLMPQLYASKGISHQTSCVESL